MKILHTSDLHLGRIIYGRSLIEDQIFFIENCLIKAIETEHPDLIIIAGDIFDRAIAPVAAIDLFDRIVSFVCLEKEIPLLIIAGNHDGAKRLSMGSRLLEKAGLYIYSNIQYIPAKFQIGNVCIYPIPYFDPAEARDVLKDDTIHSFSDAFCAITHKIYSEMDSTSTNLMISHCFVTGGVRSESESVSFVGGSGEVNSEIFDGFDYVAAGHLHKSQKIGKVYYSGSPLKYSFDEENYKKSLTIIEIDQKHIATRSIPVVALRNVRTIFGTIDQLLCEPFSDDYIFAELCGTPVFEPMAKLRKNFPNVLGIRRVESINPAPASALTADSLRGNNEVYIFNEFLRQICSQDATDDDISIFNELCASLLRGDE